MLKFGSKSDINASYKCTVRLLDDTEVLEVDFQAHHRGKYLLEHVCRQLNLVEHDYFGLRYVDASRQRHWLDMAKTVIKQIKEMEPILFSFRVKFYPPDPFKLKEEITRYQIYLQLKRDLLHGRLYCNQSEAALLGAYIVQAELGDYDPDEHEGNYVQDLKILLKQTAPIEEKMLELHQTQLKGQSPVTTETHFLKKACQLDTYGVDPHPVKDHRGNTLYLGINHCGILTFQGSRKTHHFNWSEVQKINYEGKMFIIHLVYHEKKHTVGFKCPTGAACRHVWRCAIEQMLFYTLPKSSDAPVVTGGGFFSWGTKFKYSGRTEREILEEIGPLRKDEPTINRVGSLRRKASSVPATPSTPVGSDLGYSTLPRSNYSVPDSRLDSDNTLLLTNDVLSANLNPTSSLEPVSEDQEAVVNRRLQAVDEAVPEDVQNKSALLITSNGYGLTNNKLKGLKEMDSLDEYYFRDSFDHSSSESQIPTGGGPSHRSSRSQTPQPSHRLKTGSKTSLHQTAGVQPGTIVSLPEPPNGNRANSSLTNAQSSKKFNLFQVFVPSFLFVAISLVAATVLVLESDSDLLSGFRRLPEMVALRREYYEPAKEFLSDIIFKFLPK